jgi:hypothetical protein
MRAAISITTAAAVWLHMLLGCCAHHDHASAASLSDLATFPAAEVADHGHSQGHDHNHGVPQSDLPQQPGGSHDDCHKSHCDFLVTGSTIIVLDTLVAALPGVAYEHVVAQFKSSSANWMRDTGDHLRLPVRLHLFHQVLLI